MKQQYKTLNNHVCISIVRLACQSKWRFVAFALYNYELFFTDDLKGKIWSILSRCSDDCVISDIKSSLSDSDFSLMRNSFNRYFDCYINILKEEV